MSKEKVEAKLVKVTIADLHQYMMEIKGKDVKISLNEFIADKHPEYKDLAVIADLTDIKFDEKNKIDLTGAILAGTKLDGIEFSGKYVILKDADLRGASINGCTFTDNIDLDGTKLGSIILSSKMFKKCRLNNAEYDPTAPKIAMVAVTDKQISGYLKLREEGHPLGQGSLNDYLTQVLRHNYPEDMTIIADLSERVIDSSFNGADLTGSNLKHATITGEINNLTLRDCYLEDTYFEECKLISPDLRGTNMSSLEGHVGQEFVGARFFGQVTFIDPKLSIGGNVKKAVEAGILPREVNDIESEEGEVIGQGKFAVEGNPIFDPCYIRGSSKEEAANIRPLRKCTTVDLKDYAAECERLRNLDIGRKDLPDFNKFICDKYKLKDKDQDFTADLSEAEIKEIDLSFLTFNRCNFAYAQFTASNLEKAKFKNCNISGADFTGTLGLFGNKQTNLQFANFDDSDITCAKLDGLNAKGAKMNNVVAVNLSAQGLNISKGEARGANFSGSWVAKLKAEQLQANRANFSHVTSTGANYNNASLNHANMSFGDFNESSFVDAKVNYANLFAAGLRRTNLLRTEFKHTRLGSADITAAKMKDTKVDDADLGGLFFEKEPEIENVNLKAAIESKEAHKLDKIQIEQKIKANEKSIYNKYAIGIAVASVLLTVAAVALIHFAAPAVLAAGLIATVLPVASAITGTTIAAVAIDRFVQSKFESFGLGIKLGLVEGIANLFGAKKIIKWKNGPLYKQLEEEEQVLKQYEKDEANQEKVEEGIKKSSPSQEKEVEASGKTTFQDKYAKEGRIEGQFAKDELKPKKPEKGGRADGQFAKDNLKSSKPEKETHIEQAMKKDDGTHTH
jgi:uncharacterized protein YjbI with pentapeptide repeats